MKRLLQIGTVVLVAVVLLGAAVYHVRRQWKWAHGGDGVHADVDVAITTEDTIVAIAQGFGVPSGHISHEIHAKQTILVRLRWSSAPPSADGLLRLVVLDKRVDPPDPLATYGGWNASGDRIGYGWHSDLETLPAHYDWLRGMALRNADDTATQSSSEEGVTHFAGAESGTVVASFQQSEEAVPFTDPQSEFIVGLIYSQSGGVRWARRIYG